MRAYKNWENMEKVDITVCFKMTDKKMKEYIKEYTKNLLGYF